VTAVSSYWKYGQRLSGRSRRPVTGPVLWLQCADVPMPASAVDGLPRAGAVETELAVRLVGALVLL